VKVSLLEREYKGVSFYINFFATFIFSKMKIKNHIKYFIHAVIFFTRIPICKNTEYDSNIANKSVQYLPLIGWLVGGLSAFVFWVCMFVFPLSLSIIISIIAGILVTGAFHEDGFADVCDGFGGGWTKQKILDIMKDSRVGAFGVIGLILILLTKYFSLSSVKPEMIFISIIAGHSLSRLAAVSLIFSNNYARENEDSKAKPVAEKISITGLIVAFVLGLLPIMLFRNPMFFILVIPVFIVKFFMSRFFNKWIGGYTGDCLGAVQQVCEVVFYLSLIILCRFI